MNICLMNIFAVAGFLVVATIAFGCSDSSHQGLGRPEELNAEVFKKLEGRKVFFGHQSVGANIIEGVGLLKVSEGSVSLQIVDLGKTRTMATPAIAHAPVGKNRYPDTKLAEFSEIVKGGIGESADIALFKFCYVDVTRTTDVKALFSSYRDTLAALRVQYPGTVFMHVTVPLVARYQGWKDVVKRMLGKAPWTDADNIRRNEYNELLIAAYGGKEPIFDLALAESTHQDGRRETFTHGGREYSALVGEYASDGAHLNELGKRHVAAQFLVALAKAAAEVDRP